MKEIGGYIELDRYMMPMLHEGAIALNSGRNALAYILRAKKIKRLWIPKFLCDSVRDICKREIVEIEYYSIDTGFRPFNLHVNEQDWIYLVNYYGQISNEYLKNFIKTHSRIIVDNVQAYFQMPLKGVDTLYTCRKFFGVPDGAFLYTDAKLSDKLDVDKSYDRMKFLLGRYENTATEFYCEYQRNEKFISEEPIKYMSKLTENLLHGIDYQSIRVARTNNYTFLHEKLSGYNKLELSQIEGAFMYPFYHEGVVEIRKRLQQKKIFIPTLWPNVLKDAGEDEIEYLYAKNILPIPCDQRYDIEDMQYLVEEILKCIN